MAIVAWWRTGNTRPPALIPLYLGRNPLTGDVRTIIEGDTVTLLMFNPSADTPTVQVRGPLEVVTLDEPRVDEETGEETSQAAIFKPADGDFDEDGLYDVVFDLTDEEEDIETIPDRVAVSYQFLIGKKPGEA